MADPDHHVLPVIVNPEVAPAAELILEPKQPMTSHQEVPRVLEQVKADEVALQEGLQELEAVLEHAEDAGGGERGVEEETDVGSLGREGGLAQVLRCHQ